MDKVFISYAKEDILHAKDIYNFINQDTPYTGWLDEDMVLPGMYWDDEIMQALQTAAFIVLIVSNHSLSKTGYVQKEIKKALDRLEYYPNNRIFIIPVLIEDCTIKEPRLKKIQQLDYYKDKVKGLALLKKSLEYTSQPKIGINNIFETANFTAKESLLLIEEPEILINPLMGVNYSGKDLMNLNFKNKNLRSSNFKGANLIGTDFSGANISDCDFSFANMERANLKNCNVNNVNFSFVNLWRATISGAKNIKNIKSCEYVNIYNVIGDEFENEKLRKFKKLNLPDYGSYIHYFCDEIGLSLEDFTNRFEWVKLKYFKNMLDF